MSLVNELMKQAVLAHQTGELEQAEQLYRQVLKEDPLYPDALNLLGLVAVQYEHFEQGVALIRKAIQQRPQAVGYYCNLGNAFRAMQNWDEAKQAYQHAVLLNPQEQEARNNLANVLLQQGQPAEAISHFEKCLEFKPRQPDVYNNLGNAWRALGKLELADQAYQQAIVLHPVYPQALYNRAQLARQMGKFEDAIIYFRQAVQIKPAYVAAWDGMGNAFAESGLMKEAREAYLQVDHLLPADGTKIRLAMMVDSLYKDQQDLLQQRASVEEDLELLEGLHLQVQEPLREINYTPFYLAYQGLSDRGFQARFGQAIAKACPSLQIMARHCQEPLPKSRLRIAFVSQLFHHHTISKLMGGLVEQLDRERFEVCALVGQTPADPWAHWVWNAADQAQVLASELHDAQVQLALLEADIIFYPDIGMQPLTYFLSFSRLAPLQCASWGHPMTTGSPAMDAFFSSVDLEGTANPQEEYTETLIQMRHLIPWFRFPQLPEKLDKATVRAELGLPEHKRLYVCPQTLFKLHPEFDFVLAELLATDPEAHIILIDGRQPHWKQRLLMRFRQQIPHGVERIHFVPPMPERDFFKLVAAADLLLDPLHFGGGNTSYEAFAVGTPVVTCPSPYLKGRITSAMYRQMGLTDLIATDRHDYVRKAVNAVQDSAYNQFLRDEIAARRGVLYENKAAMDEVGEWLWALAQQRQLVDNR